jgi:hypothetical protein
MMGVMGEMIEVSVFYGRCPHRGAMLADGFVSGKNLMCGVHFWDFLSDMSFGALSEEAKIALATGAEMAGTGICSGEGGMLPEEQAACSRYFYELASAKFGFKEELLCRVQAFHFKGGQGAKTGTGGHLPGAKVQGRIAQVRGLEQQQLSGRNRDAAGGPPTTARDRGLRNALEELLSRLGGPDEGPGAGLRA